MSAYREFSAYGPSHLAVLALFAVGAVLLVMVGRRLTEAQARLWFEYPETTKKDFENKDASPLFGYPDGCCLMIVEKTLGIFHWILDEEAPYLVDFINR